MNSIIVASRAVLCGVLAIAVTTATGCGSENKASESAQVGTVTIPLQAQVNGTNYRLQAVFEIAGPHGVTTLTTTPEQQVLTATLPTGQYTATLLSFTLFKDDGTGTFHAVEATVESSTQSFTVADQSTTTVSFQFDTDGTIVPVGSGNVNITFGVTDTSCNPIVVDSTQRTVQSARFFLDFSNGIANNPEEVDVLEWAGGTNLAQSFAVDACSGGIVEHFGNSWVPPDPNSGGRVLVGSGSTGTWEHDGSSIVIRSSSSGCPASGTVPVETRYQFRQGIGQDTIEVQRRFDFSGAPLAESQSFRPFMPRLTVAFDRVLHPDASGTVLRSEDVLACPYGCQPSDWDGSWFAYYASSGPLAGQGVIVLRAPSPTSASLWIDNDAGTTYTNASSVLLSPPAGGFTQTVSEREVLCFFDAGSWTIAGQAALELPPGCRLDLACNADGKTQATNEQKLPLDEVASGDLRAGNVALTENRVLVSLSGGSLTNGLQPEVFVRSGTTWTPEAPLVAADPQSGDAFGSALAFSDDMALVGAPQQAGVGAVYFFSRQGNAWAQQQKIVPDDGSSGESFGSSLALDATTAALGSDGRVRVFTYARHLWFLQRVFTHPSGTLQNGFGRVALDGNTLVIGSLRDTVGPNSEQGSAYVYERSGTSWTLTQQLVAADAQPDDHFGNTVAVSGDTIVVGVDSFFHPDRSGAAYVFVRQGGSFVQQAKLLSPDGAPQDEFGLVVALQGDLALIGANQHEHGGVGTDTGAAYLFQRTQSQWRSVQELTASDPTNDAKFGAPLALSRTHAAINAPGGGAYVFDL